jgi:hypothetical protein
VRLVRQDLLAQPDLLELQAPLVQLAFKASKVYLVRMAQQDPQEQLDR